MTASLQGEIRIRTSSIDEAITSVKKMGKDLEELGKSSKTVKELSDEFNRANRQAVETAKGLDKLAKSEDDAAKTAQRLDNMIAKAANTVANFNQRVSKSGASQEQQNAIIAKSRQELDLYSQSLRKTDGDALSAQTAQTQLQVSLGELNRELREQANTTKSTAQSSATVQRAVGQLTISYERLVSQVQGSAMSDNQKTTALERLNREYTQSKVIIEKNGTATEIGAKAQVAFRQEVARTTEQMRAANREFRGQAMDKFNLQMRDLTSSVQVALGPLSGVASRLTAIGGIVRRNDIGIAGLVATTVAFAVAMTKVVSIGSEAERQLLALDAQIESLGLSSQTSSGQMNEMARKLAADTLTSAHAVREAQSALLNFHNIGVDAFESVLLASQGLSQTFGGSLAQSTQRLGRLLNDPVNNFAALERQSIRFTDAEKERITLLQRTGQLTAAQTMIMGRFEAVMARATNETRGIKGALDAVGDNFALVAEGMYETGNIGETVAAVITKVADALLEFGQSETAVTLAETFGTVLKAVGNVVAFAIDNFKTLTLAAVILATRGFAATAYASIQLNKIVARGAAIFATSRAAIAGWVTGAKTYITTTNVATMATRALSLAVRALLGPLGIALIAAEVLGATNIMGSLFPSDKTEESLNNAAAIGKSILEVRDAAEELGTVKSLELAAKLQQEVDAIDTAAAKLEEVVEGQEGLFNGWANNLKLMTGGLLYYAVATSKSKKAVAEANEEFNESSANAKLNAEEFQKALAAEVQRTKAIADSNAALKEQTRLAKAITDSEGQRIDTLNEQLAQIDETIRAAEALDEVNVAGIALLREQREALIAHINTMKANSREVRQNARERTKTDKLVADIVGKRAVAELQLSAVQHGLTQAQLDNNIAMVAARKAAEEQSASIQDLSQEHQQMIADSLGVGDAFKKIDFEDTAKRVAFMTTAFQRFGIEAADAQKLVIAQFATNDIAAQFGSGMNQITERYKKYFEVLEEAKARGVDVSDALINAMRAQQAEEKRLLDLQISRASTFAPQTDLERLKEEWQEKRAFLQEQYAYEGAELQAHLDRLDRSYKNQKGLTAMAELSQKGADIFAKSSEVMQAAGLENTKAGKAMALAQVAFAEGVAIANIWKDHSANPAYAGILTALAAAKIGAQIATINSAGFRDGGFVSGKGSARSDSIPANLSNGEFVMNARATQQLGVPFLNALNSGSKPLSLANGGFIGASEVNATVSRTGTPSITVIDQSTRVNDTSVETETTMENGVETTRVYIRDMVRDLTMSGELDGTNSQVYGLRRRGTRR